jgi:16S rRNA (cytidine1402-2'-O)-methyltransferase
VFFETPHRILECLDDIGAVFGARPVVLARELTKLHEEFLRGPASVLRSELASRPAVKGEITLLIAKGEAEAPAAPEALDQAFADLLARGVDRMTAIKTLARQSGLPKRDLYRRLIEPKP